MAGKSQEHMDIRNTDEKYDFEQKEFNVQKVFWVLVILFLVAGLLGLFGAGPLSSARAEEEEFYIEYDRFLRDDTPGDFSVFIKSNPGDKSVIALSQDYVEKIRVESVVPQPESVEAKGRQLIYVFNAADSALITFNITAKYAGAMTLEITVQGKTKYLNQYVFF